MKDLSNNRGTYTSYGSEALIEPPITTRGPLGAHREGQRNYAYNELDKMAREKEQTSEDNHFKYGNLIIFKKLLKNFKKYRKKKI